MDAKHNDEAGTEGPDGRCDVCGGLIIEDHQLWTYTDAEGVYDFDNLPGYVLVSNEVDYPAAPGEDIDKVYQPYGVANANGTALSTSDLVALQKRPVSVGMIRQLAASEIVSLSADQIAAIKADADMLAAFEARQAELKDADPTFTSATPYLTGYAIKVVDDSGEYVASRFHVEGAGTGDNSDLTSFESSLTDNVNGENEKANEVYAVVAEKIADGADLTGGILSSAYAVRYLKTNYDLANRMYYKRAFDAGLTKQLPVLIDGNVWNDVNSDGLMDEDEERIEGAVVRLVRYWYDETGIGYWEQAPGQTPGGDGSFENSGLTRDEYDEIVAMADPFKPEGETMTPEEHKAAADAMTAYINELYTSVAAMPEGAARAEAATKNLMKLNVLYHNHTEFLTSYTEIVPGESETGEAEAFTTRVMAASAPDARADAGSDGSTNAGDGSTNNGNGIYGDDYVTEMLAWIATATQEDLEKMDAERRDAIFGKHQTDENGNLLYLDTVIENGKEVEKVNTNATNSVTGEPNLPYYDNTGSQRLYEAYQARIASLIGDNQWSDLNWFSSLAHGYGLFRIAQAHIAGVVWQDDNYNGLQDAGENVRISNVPVSLKRYWFGTDETGTGWHLDETFSMTTTSGSDGRWIFDNLDVAGKRMVNGKETCVLYGFEVTVDDLPHGFGVTHMNRGSATTDSDLNEDTKLIEPGDPQGGLIVLAQPSDRRDLVGNGASYTPTALAAIEGQKVRSDDGWTEVTHMDSDVNGAYRFDGLPMVDGNDKPYLYRVRSYMPDGKEWVAINVGTNENNDSDWGEAANSVIGAGGRVGITPAMSVLGAFAATRTTPNAYGQKFNLLVPYNWVPEDGRSVDLGMTGDADAWRTLVFTTPWGTRLFYVKLPQTGDGSCRGWWGWLSWRLSASSWPWSLAGATTMTRRKKREKRPLKSRGTAGADGAFSAPAPETFSSRQTASRNPDYPRGHLLFRGCEIGGGVFQICASALS